MLKLDAKLGVKLKVGSTAPRGVDSWLTNVRDGRGVFELEAETYNTLAGGTGIPHVWWFGEEWDFHLLVEDLLGPRDHDPDSLVRNQD